MPYSWAKILSIYGPTAQSRIMWPAVKDLTQVFPGTFGPVTLRLTWTYGATTAVWAAITLLLASIVSPEPPARPARKNPNHHLSPAAGGSLQETAAD